VIRIAIANLIQRANIGREYVELLANASTTIDGAHALDAAVEQALANPTRQSNARRTVAEELFFGPGEATTRAVAELYALMELDAPVDTRSLPMRDVYLPLVHSASA
jgi:hypothetical protein